MRKPYALRGVGKMKTVLLIGEIYSHNLGDPLLCKTVESLIALRHQDSKVVFLELSGKTVIINEDVKRSRLKGTPYEQMLITKNRICGKIYKTVQAWSPYARAYCADRDRHIRMTATLELLLKIFSFDVAVFAGGSLFMDYFSGNVYSACKILKKAGIPIIFHACGMGPLSSDSIKILKQAFRMENVRAISLRDSYQLFEDVFNIPFVRTNDTALLCSEFYKPSDKKKYEIGMGIIDVPEVYDCQVRMLRCLIRSDHSWKLFTNGSEYDFAIAGQLLRDVGIDQGRQNQYVVERPQSVEQLVKDITSFDCIVSFRLHSQIIASSFGIPNYGIIWSKKIEDFHESMGQGSHAHAADGGFSFLEKLSFQKDSSLYYRANHAGAQSKEVLYQSLDLIG